MSSVFQDAKFTASAAFLTPTAAPSLDQCRWIFEENRHRVYAIAFWMTDNELIAEEVMQSCFEQVFALGNFDSEDIDRILLAELQKRVTFETPSLKCLPSTEVTSARRNTRRVDLERAVVQLPATEKLVFLMHDVESYEHDRIGRLLGLTEKESQNALHQARLRIRELLAKLS